MKLDEFIQLIEKEREALRLTNQEKIAKIVNNNNKKGNN